MRKPLLSTDATQIALQTVTAVADTLHVSHVARVAGRCCRSTLSFIDSISLDKLNRKPCLPGHKDGETMKTTTRRILCLGALFATCAYAALASATHLHVTKTLSLTGTNAHGANYFNG